MAALKDVESSELDERLASLDLSKYKSVFVSFGSFDQRLNHYNHPHVKPFFLEQLGHPYLCISIDPRYESLGFKNFKDKDDKDVDYDIMTVPVKNMSLKEAELKMKDKQDYNRIVAEFSINETIEITKKIVSLLETTPIKNVFFVDFIKFSSAGGINNELLKNAVKLKEHTGKYFFYDWCGFTPYSDFIMRYPNDGFVKTYLESRPIPPASTQLLTALNGTDEDLKAKLTTSSDNELKIQQKYEKFRYSLLSLTQFVGEDNLKYFRETGGSRKRKTNRKTKSKSNRKTKSKSNRKIFRF
jgi:hypothetical protein